MENVIKVKVKIKPLKSKKIMVNNLHKVNMSIEKLKDFNLDILAEGNSINCISDF